MPYRRLPKTDQARLRALKQAIRHAGEVAFNQQAVNYGTIAEAQRFLMSGIADLLPIAPYQENRTQHQKDRRKMRKGEINKFHLIALAKKVDEKFLHGSTSSRNIG